MTEESTIELLNNKFELGLIKAEDKYSSFDAESSNFIVEIKNRRKYYDSKVIEALKLFTNYQKSQLKDKEFLYVVEDPKGVWIFNISKNIKEVIKEGAQAMWQPRTTDFSCKDKIVKYSYLLKESLAYHLEV